MPTRVLSRKGAEKKVGSAPPYSGQSSDADNSTHPDIGVWVE